MSVNLGDTNNTNTSTNATMTGVAATRSPLVAFKRAKDEYPRIFEALAENTIIIILSIGVTILVVIIFALARLYIAYINAGDARIVAEREAVALREANLKFKEELKAQRLDAQQVEMIKENAPEVETKVPTYFKLDWHTLTLYVLLTFVESDKSINTDVAYLRSY